MRRLHLTRGQALAGLGSMLEYCGDTAGSMPDNLPPGFPSNDLFMSGPRKCGQVLQVPGLEWQYGTVVPVPPQVGNDARSKFIAVIQNAVGIDPNIQTGKNLPSVLCGYINALGGPGGSTVSAAVDCGLGTTPGDWRPVHAFSAVQLATPMSAADFWDLYAKLQNQLSPVEQSAGAQAAGVALDQYHAAVAAMPSTLPATPDTANAVTPAQALAPAIVGTAPPVAVNSGGWTGGITSVLSQAGVPQTVGGVPSWAIAAGVGVVLLLMFMRK